MVKQTYVTRLYYGTEVDALDAHAQLENMGIFGDVVESDRSEVAKWKVVFAEKELVTTDVALKRLTTKPQVVEVYDPTCYDTTGWGNFSAKNNT